MNHLDTKGTEPLQKPDRTVRNQEEGKDFIFTCDVKYRSIFFYVKYHLLIYTQLIYNVKSII